MAQRIGAAAVVLGAALVGSLLMGDLPTRAAASGGTIEGQVLWCAPVPLPYAVPAQPGVESPPVETTPDGAEGIVPGEPTVPDSGRAYPVPRPPRQRSIPAGAVLVAVQGTALSARTDENGRFRITDVPVGQYFTVAAGPVRGIDAAIALRPNVLIAQEGQTVDVGRLSLGQPCGYGPVPYTAEPQGGEETEP